MKDSKTLLLLFVSLLLLLASITLLWSWGYQFSFKHTDNAKPAFVSTALKDSIRADYRVSDSLKKAYYYILDHLDKTIDSAYNHSDSLKDNLDNRLTQFYQLRNQINDLFKNRKGDDDVKFASVKIAELQQRIVKLRISNSDVESENRRLNNLLKQYADQRSQLTNTIALASSGNNTFMEDITPAEVKPVSKNKLPVTPTRQLFFASDLRLLAWTEEDGKNLETLSAADALKLTGSFVVKNNSSQDNDAEIFIVITQPDGKVMQKSTWESGLFETLSGKKIYSCKLQADCKSGEIKKLQFWLANDKYQKGTYQMSVYQNGNVLAKITKQLS